MRGTRVYSDGSGLNNKIGAAAVLYRPNGSTRTLRYHLGSADQHTIYESEAVGLLLAANLILDEPDIDVPISIFVDNQAAIKSSDIFQTRSGHYLIDNFQATIRQAKAKHHL